MRILIIAIPMFFLVGSAIAQTSSGLTGIITDTTGSRLADVKVTAASKSTGVTQSVLTNAQGEFILAPLQPGNYDIVAELQGFQRHSHPGLVLELGRMIRVDATLQVGQVSETVEMTAQAPLLESETATVGQYIEDKTVRDMPLNGRRAGELLKLMGNAVYVQGDVIRPRVSVAGSRGDQQQWLLDGVNASNLALEIPQALFNPPVESVQEIRIQQNNYSAEFGNSSGGVVTMVTRSGTNAFHGSAYEFYATMRWMPAISSRPKRRRFATTFLDLPQAVRLSKTELFSSPLMNGRNRSSGRRVCSAYRRSSSGRGTSHRHSMRPDNLFPSTIRLQHVRIRAIRRV